MKERLRIFFNKYLPEVVLHLPITVGISYFFYGKVYFESWQNLVKMSIPWFFMGLVIAVGNNWVLRTMMKRFKKLDDWPKRVAVSLLGYLFFTLGSNSLTQYILRRLPYPELVLSDKLFYTVLIISITISFFFATIYEGITYFGKWKEAISEAEELEKLTLESQFRSLQNQLNPHFLFNSFNVLSSLISESPRRAEDFVDELSNVYRYLLRSNEQELATVADELRFIRSYFHLLETRHDTGISLEIIVNKGVLDKKLPTLALQVLVENAVKHNEISPEKPLKVEILESGHALLVRNNMQRKSTKPLSNQVGLENLRERYHLLGVVGFEVMEDGKVFSVSLPMV